jgi:hypothetical protein
MKIDTIDPQEVALGARCLWMKNPGTCSSLAIVTRREESEKQGSDEKRQRPPPGVDLAPEGSAEKEN